MKSASLKEIKVELNMLNAKRIQEVCLRMVKFRKENKELLTYLLFGAEDEKAYVDGVKAEMDEMFAEAPVGNTYLGKKAIRKILSLVNRQIKYSGSRQTEVELLIHFCKKLRKSGSSLSLSTPLGKIYFRQLQKIDKSLKTLHEDLQFDYSEEMKAL
jgi:hypothetical protein